MIDPFRVIHCASIGLEGREKAKREVPAFFIAYSSMKRLYSLFALQGWKV